ncbi:MAG: hypothetical protein ACYS9X_28895, partial [Planctomycetota bacterium]
MRKLFGPAAVVAVALASGLAGCGRPPRVPEGTGPTAAPRGTEVAEAPPAPKPEAPAEAEKPWTEDVLALSGYRGGITVHLGCGTGTNTPKLWAMDTYVEPGHEREAYTVHGL